MKYCSHCGYKFDDKKFESKKSTYAEYKDVIAADTEISYVCPRCGHLIHDNLDEEDIKSLSRACHSELQRGRNSLARGMSAVSIGLILLVTAIIFFALSNKVDPVRGGKRITTTAPEFWVGLVMAVVSVILLGIGCLRTVQGLLKKKTYSVLLKDINNKTFFQ